MTNLPSSIHSTLVKANLDSVTRQLQGMRERLGLIQDQVNALVPERRMFEMARSVDQLQKGDVVAIDRDKIEPMSEEENPDADLPVKLANSEESHKVIGVVWGLNEKEGDDQRYHIVVRGRVFCKVIGRIKPGDLP